MQPANALPTVTDRRQKYLYELLVNSGYQVISATTSPGLDFIAAGSDEKPAKLFVLLPIPVSPLLLEQIKKNLTPQHIVLGGNLPDSFISYCNGQHISYIDYFSNPAIAIENAVATAEGAICEAIQASDYNLHQSPVLVIGFGKCGEILAAKLAALSCQVTVSTRDSIARARAKAYGYHLSDTLNYSDFHILFNTAPAPVIDATIINCLKPDAVIIDIASKPGGTDFNYCAQKGITAKLCPGMPGKYSPKTSAQILFDQIKETLSHMAHS